MAFPKQLKPETIARLAREREQQRIEQRASTIARLQEAVAEKGPDSIYAEMLAELQAAR